MHPRESVVSTASAFDRHSTDYARTWGEDPAAKAQRRAVWQILQRVLPPSGRVLDAGCGVGIDAEWLLAAGHEVVAIDASEGMVAQTAVRAPAAHPRVLSVVHAASLCEDGAPRFDGALLNFGVINCVDPAEAGAALGAVLTEGAPLVLVSMPRLAPASLLRSLAGGHLRQAAARCQPELDIDVAGLPVRTRYWGAGQLSRALSPWFELEHHESLGLLLPPAGSGMSEATVSRLAALEVRLRHLPLLRDMGDHLLLVLRRRRDAARLDSGAP